MKTCKILDVFVAMIVVLKVSVKGSPGRSSSEVEI